MNSSLSIVGDCSPSEGRDELLTRKEVASLLKISLPTLHHHHQRGILVPTHKVGRRLLYLKSEVLRSIEYVQFKAA